MKTSKVVLSLVTAFFLGGSAVTAFAAPPNGWPSNKGEICLEVVESGAIVGTVNMYVTKMGDGHYLVLGRNIEPAEVVPFIGTAEIVATTTGPMVKMHVTASGVMPPVPPADPGDVHGNMTTVMLDPSTLEGTVETLNLMALKDNTDFRVEAGSVRYLRRCGP